MKTVYLDYNATTPVDPSVRDAMMPFLGSMFGNPSSLHCLGTLAADAIQQSREEVAGLLNCQAHEVLFTSGGTESSNLAILGLVSSRCAESTGHIIISAIEHPATIEPARWLERQGHEVTLVGCDRQGVIDASDVAAAIQPNTVLVSIMHANNEVGSLQPIRAVADICQAAGVILHIDAAQAVGKIAIDLRHLGADMATIAGHKFYAPKGIGALFVRQGIELEPVIHGGGQERGLSPGTENVSQIVGLGVAARLASERLPEAAEHMRQLRDLLQSGLQSSIGTDFSVNAADAERLPNTLSANFPNVVGAELLAGLPHLCASTGAACHSGSTRMSATLTAMQVPEHLARGTIRLSVGRSTSSEEVEQAQRDLTAAWQKLR